MEEIRDYWVFKLCPSFDILKNTGPNIDASPPPHLRRETDPVSEMLCSSEYQMMDKVQKSSNPENTP
jgi:hypothetical protein